MAGDEDVALPANHIKAQLCGPEDADWVFQSLQHSYGQEPFGQCEVIEVGVFWVRRIRLQIFGDDIVVELHRRSGLSVSGPDETVRSLLNAVSFTLNGLAFMGGIEFLEIDCGIALRSRWNGRRMHGNPRVTSSRTWAVQTRHRNRRCQ